MNLTELVPLIRDLGITGVTLLVILLRIEPKLEAVTRAVERLTDAVQVHAVSVTIAPRRGQPGGDPK